MATIAESPPVRCSKLSTAPESSQPLPVVVATSRLARSKPPARSRSATRELGALLHVGGRLGAGVGPDQLQSPRTRSRQRRCPRPRGRCR